MVKKEEGTVGRNGARQLTATKVKTTNKECGIVTLDTVPTTTILILLPRDYLWIRIITHMKI